MLLKLLGIFLVFLSGQYMVRNVDELSDMLYVYFLYVPGIIILLKPELKAIADSFKK